MKDTDNIVEWVKEHRGIDLLHDLRENAPVAQFFRAAAALMREVPAYLDAVLAEKLPK